MSTAQANSPGAMPARLFSLDALRGLIVVLMALDHANIFVAHGHPPAEIWGGPFPVFYDPVTFLTRFVTHFCAPGFFLLMGAGMALFAHSRQAAGWSRWAVTRYFLIRGAALIAIKLLIVNRAWELTPGGWGIQFYAGVLFALGANMLLGSLLLRLRPGILLALTAVLMIGTEFLVPAASAWGPRTNPLELLLLVPGGMLTATGDSTLLWVNYPLLPWLGLVTMGMALGQWLATDPAKAYGRAWKLGLAFLAAFLVVRALDGFGNIRPRMGDTWMDFLTLVKYPPSLAFTLLTTGVNLLVLRLFAQAGARGQRVLWPLAVFGSAPLFFYVVHLFVYAGIGYLITPQGTPIPLMYPFWLLGLAILFPLCLWFGRFKRRQPATSLLRVL